jgi:TonB family protein
MKFLAWPMLLSLLSYGAAQSPPRDPRPPVSDPNRQERTLLQAAAANPTSAAAQHSVAVFFWDKTRALGATPEEKLSYVLKGIAAEDRALAIDGNYVEALVYKNIFLRLQANLTADPAEQKRLIDEADMLRTRAISLRQVQGGIVDDAGGRLPAPPPSPEPPFTGFDEPFEQAQARLTPVRVGGEVRTPAKIRDSKPVYPPIAQSARVQGVVILEAIIGADGNVANARVMRSIPLLDAAALGAVSNWQFQPTQLNGQPVPVIMTVTVNFALQ